MSRIRSKNTSIEVSIRRALHALGFRFRLNRNDLPGRPDIVLPRYKAVIFVHGCFCIGTMAARSRLFQKVIRHFGWRSSTETRHATHGQPIFSRHGVGK
ncbi:hypothetical protein [Methylorubrum rhodinum]|uniref:hypothetical protein n=1 Tax=Methylorubrum rhodinum TaxID=29428 RepID=UPI0028AE00D4|nr:hypothetical protein [Methylorubrum rhodinum]